MLVRAHELQFEGSGVVGRANRGDYSLFERRDVPPIHVLKIPGFDKCDIQKSSMSEPRVRTLS